MFPTLANIGGYTIYSYGFFIALGYVTAMAVGCHLARRRGLEAGPYMDLSFIAIVSGVVGARILFVLTSDQPISAGELFDVWNGGLVFYGGFLLAAPACLLYGRWKKLPIGPSLDFVGVAVPLAHAFGRLGCFAAGCCHGSACSYPWGMVLQSDFVKPALRGQALHPVQLYESALLFLLSGLLYVLARGRKLRDGNVFFLYVASYGAIRIVTEGFRGDDERGYVLWEWLSTSQAIGVALLLCGGGVLAGRLRRKDL